MRPAYVVPQDVWFNAGYHLRHLMAAYFQTHSFERHTLSTECDKTFFFFTLLHSSYKWSPTENMSGRFIRRHACVNFYRWPFRVEMLTAHEGPADDSDRGASSDGVLLRCQLCLQAVYKLLMYSKAQMCPPAPDVTHRSPIHALRPLFINTVIVSISGGGGGVSLCMLLFGREHRAVLSSDPYPKNTKHTWKYA